MESLASELSGMIRDGETQSAFNLYMTFLVSMVFEITNLDNMLLRLQSESDVICARIESGEKVKHEKVILDSFQTEIKKTKKQLKGQHESLGSYSHLIPIFFVNLMDFCAKIETFKTEFLLYIRTIGDSQENLRLHFGDKGMIHYANVRGDGACLYRSFLTALAYNSTQVILPYDPKGIHEWILRLKLLMCQHIYTMVKRNPEFERELLTIPVNGQVDTLEQYIQMFLQPAYYGTDVDIQILADMFGQQFIVIFEREICGHTHQKFVPRHQDVNGTISVLFGSAHFSPIITFDDAVYLE